MYKKIFFVLLILFVSKAQSQIVYTSVNPNFEIDFSSVGSAANLFPIDFNNDGVVDFNFRYDVYNPGNYFVHITSSNSFSYNPNNKAMGTGTFNSYGVPYAKPLAFGTDISSASANWITEQRGPLLADQQNPNFMTLGDRYIGVRFLVNGQNFYGWILVSLGNNKLMIKSYAYQSTPNTGISAGDTGGSLDVKDNNNPQKRLKIFPNPTDEYIKISGLKGKAHYKIYNMDGKNLKNGIANSDTQIMVSELVRGEYMMIVEENDQPVVMKFIHH